MLVRAVVALGVVVAVASACDGSDQSAAEPSAGGETAIAHAGREDNGRVDNGGSAAASAGSITSSLGGSSPGVGGVAVGGQGGVHQGAGGEPETPGAGPGGDGGAASFIDEPDAEPRILAERTRFVDYGKLRVAFNRAVDAETLKVSLSPAAPARLSVLGVESVNAGTIDVSLSFYHLPLVYEVHVVGELQDGTPFDLTREVPGNGSRIGFLTKQTGPGDFKVWPGAPVSAQTGRDAADGICQADAEAAGFRGKFVAYLSGQDRYDAGCRALGLDGTLAEQCGLPSQPNDDAPWLTPTGLPIVNGASGIIANEWLRPITFHADGSVPPDGDYTWTGTGAGAVVVAFAGDGSSPDCNDWSWHDSKAVTHTGYGRFLASQFVFQWVVEDLMVAHLTCDLPAQLLCLQVGDRFFGPSTLHLSGSKVAFVAENFITLPRFGDMPTLKAADQLCRDEAAGAGLPRAQTFRAYLGDDASDSLCRILGLSGKVEKNCGLKALPSEPLWRRTDGLPLGTPQQLWDGELSYPNLMSATGATMYAARPLTSEPCRGDDSAGTTLSTSRRWMSWLGQETCASPVYHFYCFEG